MPTKIEWAEESWNPITGCDPISEGCLNCYAKRMSKRLAGRFGYPADEPFRVTLHPDQLYRPLHWRKPRRVFVCSMSDLFHKDVPDDFIASALGTMAAVKRHTFLILTKRPKRMQYLMSLPDDSEFRMQAAVARNDAIRHIGRYSPVNSLHITIPQPHIWLGVSVENQKRADERIPYLVNTKAAVHFVSCEPLLEAIDLGGLYCGISWCIIGSESGPRARPMEETWVRSLISQCREYKIPVFYKQKTVRGKKISMPTLDGKSYGELPRTTDRLSVNS